MKFAEEGDEQVMTTRTQTLLTVPQENLDKQTVTDAYVYLLARALAIRQEHTDLKEPGITYNVIDYNPVGSADFVNPNLDVAYLEAWIAVDDQSPVLLEVPEVKGRYYTAQILDEWGEVITNINERSYPSHPHGKFVLVAPGSQAEVPADAVRVELHSAQGQATRARRTENRSRRSGGPPKAVQTYAARQPGRSTGGANSIVWEQRTDRR